MELFENIAAGLGVASLAKTSQDVLKSTSAKSRKSKGSDVTKSTTSTQQNSTIAAKNANNVAEAGVKNARPNQVHHYATNKSKKYSPKLKKIADKYDLDLDDIWNIESLPHQGRHLNAYHDFVVDGMKKAHKEAKGDKSKFLKLFDEYVKEPVRKNPDLLRKKGWE